MSPAKRRLGCCRCGCCMEFGGCIVDVQGAKVAIGRLYQEKVHALEIVLSNAKGLSTKS